jgi:putative hydrolase of the HAD superfamily
VSGRQRAVLFDAAGTLLEPAVPVGVTYAHHAAAAGVRLPPGRLEDAFRRVLRSAPAMAFPGLDAEEVARRERAWWRDRVRATFRAADSRIRLDAGSLESCFAALWAHYADPRAWRLRSGARDTLRALRDAGLATGVVSDFDQRLHGLLRGLGLATLLDVVVLPAESGVVKPDPRAFWHALALLGVEARDAVVVGDDHARDLEGAREAGLRAIDVGSLATLRDLLRRLGIPPRAGRGVTREVRRAR